MPKLRKIYMFEIMQEQDRLDINKIIKWLDGIACSYLIVLHDKDAPRDPHYHIFVKMENARGISDIANMSGVKRQYIEKIKSWKNALAYAFHLTDGAKRDGKYQYNKDDVIASHGVDIDAIFDANKRLEEQETRDAFINDLLLKYGNCEITKRDILNQIDSSDYNRFALMFKRMREFRVLKVRDRDMNVIYITGGAGAGKTTLAKYLAAIKNYDYFVTGSGKDVLDGYDKEECIILDDLRGDAFTLAELFKLTDNNTNSSVKSRYNNKDISYCKLMIITSIKDPSTLYNWSEHKDEPFKQFARRIDYSYLSIQDNGDILIKTYDQTSNLTRIISKYWTYSMTDVFKTLHIAPALARGGLFELLDALEQDIESKDNTDEEIVEETPFNS